MKDNGGNSTADLVLFPPKLSNVRVLLRLIALDIFVHLVYEFVILDAIGIDQWSSIVEIQQTLEIDVEVVLVLDEGGGQIFSSPQNFLQSAYFSDHKLYKHPKIAKLC